MFQLLDFMVYSWEHFIILGGNKLVNDYLIKRCRTDKATLLGNILVMNDEQTLCSRGCSKNTFVTHLLIHILALSLQIFTQPSLPNHLGQESEILTEFYLPPCVTCHMFNVTCHMSHVSCPMSPLTFSSSFFLLDNVVELVGGGTVINGA